MANLLGHTRTARSRSPLADLFVAGIALTVAWGTFAFGAVYPWAYMPLMVACAILGLAGIAVGRGSGTGWLDPWLVAALAGVVLVGLVQLCPLPSAVLATISPASDRVLRAYDLAYATGVSSSGPDVGAAGRTWHAVSVNPASTMLAITFLVALTLLLTGLLRAFSRIPAGRLAKMLVFLGMLLALVGIIQKATLGDHAWGGMKIYGVWAPRYRLVTPFGPYVNKNHYAGWMLMIVPVALGVLAGALEESARRVRADIRSRLLWLSSPEGGQALLIGFGVVVMTVALLMTRSRSGILCFLIIAAATAALSMRRFARRHALLGTAGLMLLMIVAAAWAGDDTVLGQSGSRSDSLRLRLDIWSDTLAIFRSAPFLGTGLNTFGTATMVFQTSNQGLRYQEAHNDYLQLLAEGGVLLAVPVALAIVLLARGIVRRFRARTDDPMGYWLRVGSTIGLAAIALQSTMEFSLQMPGNAAVFTVLVALALHPPAPNHSRFGRDTRLPGL